ncbi:unnamed protein product, partial [Ectocarpus fasciculatus]
MASSSLMVTSTAQQRRNESLTLPRSTTPSLYMARLVESKTRFCQFCGTRFCGIFRSKRACVVCGGIMCDGCSITLESTASHGMHGTAHG